MTLTEIERALLEEEKIKLLKACGRKTEDPQITERLNLINLLLATRDIAKPKNNNLVEIGKLFTVSLDYGDGDNEIVEGILVEGNAVNNINLTSIASQLGAALLERQVGDKFSYTIPRDFTVRGMILQATIPTMARAQEMVKKK